MTRIEQKFKDLKKQKRKAFVAYITAGYPSLAVTKKLVLAFEEFGVDVLELGVPFSDPMADGVVIQEASRVALKNKVYLRDILGLVGILRKEGVKIPIALMTYYNPVFCFGEERFFRSAQQNGVDGVIVPDLTPEEGRDFLKFANRYKVNPILFIAPTTSPERMKLIAHLAKGFIYYISLTGVTGMRNRLPPDIAANLKRIKSCTDKPVCVGFGVAQAAQVKQVYKVADGVIVGSAIVRKIKENIGRPDLIKRIGRFVGTVLKVKQNRPRLS